MLDKKALCKFADENPAPAIPPGHGLLHASQVDHIVRTAVKIIDRRRTLVLYVYDRERAAGGDPSPAWTMFQAGEDYITLARDELGSTGWRTAAFRKLGDHGFTKTCAFYSAQDEQRVCRFLRDDGHSGMEALDHAQQAILDKRTRERKLSRERRTLERMAPIRALPRGLPGWTRREIMPAYFRCEHTSAKKTVAGVCTACGKEFSLPRAVHGAAASCPRCKRELTVASAAKTRNAQDRHTVQTVERISDTEVVARVVNVYYKYDRDHLMPEATAEENARIFIRLGPDGKVAVEPYYRAFGGGWELTPWKPGYRPSFCYGTSFEADLSGHVYCKGLPEALAGTPWEYCPLEAFYGHYREPIRLVPFLQAHLEHPRLEHLVKVGFFELAAGLAYDRDYRHVLDESQNRTHRILQVDAVDVPFLRELDVDLETLHAFQGYMGLKDRQRLLRWQLDNGVTRDVDQILEHVTPHKLMKYMDGPSAPHRGTMQWSVSEYRDYLDMCDQLGYDLSNGFVLFPKDLHQAHDEAALRIKAEKDVKTRQDFEAAMAAITGHLDFEANGMKLLLPSGPKDLAAEGQALHHCVGGYAARVANKECIILFLRRCEEPDKPFYTIEIRGQKVIQVRGWDNGAPTPEVEKFVKQWKQKVLRAA